MRCTIETVAEATFSEKRPPIQSDGPLCQVRDGRLRHDNVTRKGATVWWYVADAQQCSIGRVHQRVAAGDLGPQLRLKVDLKQ
jgi:hypothetical protein